MLGVVYLLFSLVALVGWAYHQFYWQSAWLQNTTQQITGKIGFDPDYLAFPSEFWGALLLGLCICLALEGIYKMRRSGVYD